MILNLRDDHKQHVSVLLSQPEQVIQDFCRLAMEFLKKGHNHKLNASAAHKLGVEPETVRLVVEALVQLLVEGHRHNISTSDLKDSLLAIGMSENQQVVVSNFFLKTRVEINEALNSLAPMLTHYYDLQWRFDVEVASRALHQQVTPVITMKMSFEDRVTDGTLNNPKSLTSVVIQTDSNSLKHITSKLETALLEASSHHCRRTQRILSQVK